MKTLQELKLEIPRRVVLNLWAKSLFTGVTKDPEKNTEISIIIYNYSKISVMK